MDILKVKLTVLAVDWIDMQAPPNKYLKCLLRPLFTCCCCIVKAVSGCCRLSADICRPALMSPIHRDSQPLLPCLLGEVGSGWNYKLMSLGCVW